MTQIRADEGSFKDPSGRVYHIEETGQPEHSRRVVRGLSPGRGRCDNEASWRTVLPEADAEGSVVHTRLLDTDDPAARHVAAVGWPGAVEHQPVDFPTWPYEWPFSMLKDAALLQLRLLDESIPHGWMLKDATPFNIQWLGARPVFIDVPSFTPWDGHYWRAYRQFCATFLIPLLLMAHAGIPFQPLLRSRLEGIPAGQALPYFGGLRRLKRGVPAHVWFPAKVEGAMHRRTRPPRREQRQSPTRLRALLDSLRRLVAGLSYRPDSAEWTQYTDTHSYADSDRVRKEDFVEGCTADRRPSLVWDLGANTGVFSRIAARSADLVVAVDGSHDAIELLYRDIQSASNAPRNIIPVVMDVANPSPSQGWAGRERAAFDARKRPDMVLCLALVHHLRVAGNIPVALILDWLRGLNSCVVIEFVEREDEMFQKLVETKTEHYSDYTSENFAAEVQRRFRICKRQRLKNGLRELLCLEPA